MTRLIVRGLTFRGFHGVTEEEHRQGCRMRLDVEAEVEEEASASDAIEDTVDYGELAAVALAVVTTKPRRTLERVTKEVGWILLQRFPRIQTLHVRLAKLEAPVGFEFAEIGVERDFVRTL